MKTIILNSEELPTEQAARKELAKQLGCKPEEIEVAIDELVKDGVREISFYVQQLEEFDGLAIQIKLPSTRFLFGGLEH